MPDKLDADARTKLLEQKFFAEKMPMESIGKLCKYIREEKIFEAMPDWELMGMLRDVVNDIGTRLAYDDVEKVVISVQKEFGLTPYDRFSSVKEDPAKHEKTIFEKFIDYCHGYSPTSGQYNQKRRISFKDFSIFHSSAKDLHWHFEQFCKKNEALLADREKNGTAPANKDALSPQEIVDVLRILDTIHAKEGPVYGEIFAQRLKREVIFWKMGAANDKAKAEMAFKNKKPTDGIPSAVRQPMKQ